MTAIHEGLLLGPSKDILCELHQEEALAVRVEDISQALSLVLQEISDTGAGHQVQILVKAHLFCITKTNAVLYAPLLITNQEALLRMFIVVAIVQDELVQFGKLGIAVDEDFQHEIFFLLTENCQL